MKEIFSGLEKLGFKELEITDIYMTDKNDKNKDKHNNISTEQKPLTYLTSVTCPVCGNNFKEKAVKTGAFRLASKDTDFFIRYEIINPYFYDVWVCNKCGYSALKIDFLKIREAEIALVKEKISPKFKCKEYPEAYDVNIAIERYKMALINAVYTESKASKKAMICLKLAWMYRLLADDTSKEMERTFMREALKGFDQAYMKESFPIYGMDSYVTMYLIGELNRRLSNYSVALSWFSKLITSRGVKSNLKELARTQKDLIKEELLLMKKVEVNSELLNSENIDIESPIDTSNPKTPNENKRSVFNIFKKTN
jgi:uncharacterized protein (DUF2225 family)